MESLQLTVAIDVLRYEKRLIVAVMCTVNSGSPRKHKLLALLRAFVKDNCSINELYLFS
jgi:hypothetical protein